MRRKRYNFLRVTVSVAANNEIRTLDLSIERRTVASVTHVLTHKSAHPTGQMHHPAASKVVEPVLPQPPARSPRPVGLHGVHEGRDDNGEDDVAVVVGALGDSTADDGGARRREGALESKKKGQLWFILNQKKKKIRLQFHRNNGLM